MNREKGAAGATCSSCGNDVELVAQADGSVAAECCSTCYGAPVEPEPEVAPQGDWADDEGEEDA